MSEVTVEVCVNCHKLEKTYHFKVMVVQRTKTLAYNMQMCADCARQLADLLLAASDLEPEVIDASERSRSAEKGSQSRTDYYPKTGDRPGATGVRAAEAPRRRVAADQPWLV